MCELCEKAKTAPEYRDFIVKMQEHDVNRIDFSVKLSDKFKLLKSALFTSMKLPPLFILPMFEARAAYAVPNNYFQPIFLNDEKLGVAFSHGSMRSIFFVGDRLVLFSKIVNHREGQEFLTSFLLVHFEPNEFEYKLIGDELTLSVDMEKSLKNIVTGDVEKKHIKFNFMNKSVVNRIVSKEQVVQSSRFKKVYARFGGARMKAASIDMEGYAITVPHFSPHPYMLQLHEKFGFVSNRDMQEHVIDYFREHLSLR